MGVLQARLNLSVVLGTYGAKDWIVPVDLYYHL
jgi:hypothetical protein